MLKRDFEWETYRSNSKVLALCYGSKPGLHGPRPGEPKEEIRVMRSASPFAAIFWVTVLLVPGLALAGGITGKAVFEGQAPEMKPVSLTADAACEAMHKDKPVLSEVLVLGEGQSMANVMVAVTKGLAKKDYPSPAEPFVLTQEGCRYAPHVFGIRVGQKLKVMNPDGILHNVHSMPKANTTFNKAMPKDLTEVETVFEKPEDLFPFKCDIHPWMQAWCAVFDHPYFCVTGTDGTFTIPGLDPGEYEVSAWHERLGMKKATVTVGDDAANVNFTYSRAAAGTGAAK